MKIRPGGDANPVMDALAAETDLVTALLKFSEAGEVHFHPERLGDPAAAKRPQVIGVSFYDELWDPLRSERDVVRALAACDAAPQHQYVFLTKRPEQVDANMVAAFAAHRNWWLGASVTGNTGADASRCDYAKGWKRSGVRIWLSLEPWLDYLGPTGLHRTIDGADLVVIGCESGRENEPSFDEKWQGSAQEIVDYCRGAENYLGRKRSTVPVFVKQVWVKGRCSRDPAEWPADLRVQQLPEEWQRIMAASDESRRAGTA